MFKINNSKIGYIFSLLILGMTSFFISGVLACIVLLHLDNYILGPIIAGGIVSIPFGLLVGSMNSGHWIKMWLENLFKIFGKIDLNFLTVIIEFGIGIGLSIGLYSMLKRRSTDSSF